MHERSEHCPAADVICIQTACQNPRQMCHMVISQLVIQFEEHKLTVLSLLLYNFRANVLVFDMVLLTEEDLFHFF